MEFEMSSGTAGGAIAAKLEPADRPLAANEAGRRCAHPQCQTALSRYNPDDTCNAHGGWSDRTVKRPGRKPKAAARSAPAAPEPDEPAAAVTAELAVAPEGPGEGGDAVTAVRDLLEGSDAAVRTDGERTVATADLPTIMSLVEQVHRRASQGRGRISTTVRVVDDGPADGAADGAADGPGGEPDEERGPTSRTG